jgi:type IV secretory pathway VirB10-like protein
LREIQLNNKEYPRPVTLRKGLIVVATMVTLCILLLILANLFRSSHPSLANGGKNIALRELPNLSDTNWYQNQKIIKTSNAISQQRIPPKIKEVSGVTIAEHPIVESPSEQNQYEQKEIEKAMSASITSNQLTADTHVSSSSNFLTTPLQDRNSISEIDPSGQAEKKAFMQIQSHNLDDDYLKNTLKNPVSPYELQAGTNIEGELITGINSDLPGQLTGQVKTNVYDTITGRYLLIPQGAKLIGLYDSKIVYGQERVLVVWKRIMFPNGQSINLEGMPGVDLSGYAGFHDKVDNHYVKIFGSVILMSALGAGAQLSQPQQSISPWAAPTVGQTLAQSLGTNISNVATTLTEKNTNIPPTLKIRQGYLFNITVTKDIVFSGPYESH